MNAGLRRFFRFVFLAASVVASCALAPMVAQAYGDRGATPGDFDYYVLAMSWSPTYCDGREEGDGGRDRYDPGGGYGRDRYDGGGGYGRDRYDGGGGYGRDRYDGGGYGRDRYDGGGYSRYHFYGRQDYDRNDDSRGYSRRRGDSDQQCSGARPYSFVLHGFWPQYERRGWPEMCESDKRPWVPQETIDQMMDIMPSRQLVIQEYKKHGVCSGLD